jgi:Phytanoyl-CoA dioxygenase (PhyH)
MAVLSDRDCERFIVDGFIALRGAVPRDVIDRCVEDLRPEFAETGVDIDDSSTWSKPVVRVNTPITHSFIEAGTQPMLYAAYDRLLGKNRWHPPGRLGASVPVRFPSDVDPGDAGWHVDHSFVSGDHWRVNVFSAQRALLCLFLLSDVTTDDAPTEIKVGSHFDAAVALQPFGVEGVSFHAGLLPATTFDRASAFATGQAGDVFLCHPFLVHRATWPHRGTEPRYLAQPGIQHRGGSPTFAYERSPFTQSKSADTYPVETAICMALSKRA